MVESSSPRRAERTKSNTDRMVFMQSDIERWNQKYRDGNPNPDFAPDPVLKTCVHLLDGKGTALDVACGVGHNAMFLARLGYEVVAIDASLAGLTYCREAMRGKDLRLSLIAADLENFPLPRACFDVVLVIRYLYRPLIARLKTTVKPGGLVIYQTFNLNYLREKPGLRREYLLEPGELMERFADFEPIVTNDSPRIEENLTYWIGRRPPAPA